MQSGGLNARWCIAYLPVPALWKEILSITADKKLRQMSNGVETIEKFCSRKFHISSLLHIYTPREGLDAAKLFMGVAGNDVRVDIKVGLHITIKQLLQGSSLVVKLIQILS